MRRFPRAADDPRGDGPGRPGGGGLVGRRSHKPGPGHRVNVSGVRWNSGNFAFAVYHYQDGVLSFSPGIMPGSKLPPERRVSWVPLVYRRSTTRGHRIPVRAGTPLGRAGESPSRIQIDSRHHKSHEIRCPRRSPATNSLKCPSNRGKVEPGMPEPLHYVGIAGLGTDAPTLPAGHPAGVFGYDRRTRTADITDGAVDDDDAGRDDDGERSLDGEQAGNGTWPGSGPSALCR